MESAVLDYLTEYFLGPQCSSGMKHAAGTNFSYNQWSCPCTNVEVDYMPSLSLKIENQDDWYVLDQKDYFLFPYYGLDTMPSNCLLSLQSLTQGEEQIQDSYILGQVFVRKYGMVL